MSRYVLFREYCDEREILAMISRLPMCLWIYGMFKDDRMYEKCISVRILLKNIVNIRSMFMYHRCNS